MELATSITSLDFLEPLLQSPLTRELLTASTSLMPQIVAIPFALAQLLTEHMAVVLNTPQA